MQLTTITSKGQVTIPKKIRDKFSLKPFDKVRFVVVNGDIQLKTISNAKQLQGRYAYKAKSSVPSKSDFKKAIKDAVVEKYLKKNKSK